jgi:hypothetical protein
MAPGAENALKSGLGCNLKCSSHAAISALSCDKLREIKHFLCDMVREWTGGAGWFGLKAFDVILL